MRRLTVALYLGIIAGSLLGLEFRYKLEPGEAYRVISRVSEKVRYGQIEYANTFLNRIAIEVTKREGERVFCEARFVTAAQVGIGWDVYSMEREYESRYWLSPSGKVEIAPEYVMPVVRDVPLFPEEDVQPGDSWVAQGEEVHDFEELGLTRPFRFPILVRYTYEGEVDWKGRRLHLLKVEYPVFHEPSVPDPSPMAPVRIHGYSRQRHYWDAERGMLVYYEEEFAFVLTLKTGDVYEFTGTADAEVVWASPLDREKVREEVEAAIEDLQIPDAEVETSEEGVTIRLENIQFPPDSAVLLPEEQEKLRKIAQILSRYPERDLLVEGHTALAGTPEGRLALSIERAKAVADFLMKLGVRRPEQIVIQGYGATRPIADNATEAGRSRNRRVEITILEN
ncbi:OmpA/MotB domain protein [Spirochaeta thermophila DSM 6578]|uniref:OmpA/MotB domain protein n=1 Tax=Winmispira thermophila (strain ATCC 700085 / DSM 6578 / Z-1203) TaxID=869211 RepID=G0GBR0_WINT7|nr:OmpA family protein [Spirochaeta thermophila]AEJ61138.1 OmpA/MotB domain protein [Spirochaeta thermophila DSM 6578]